MSLRDEPPINAMIATNAVAITHRPRADISPAAVNRCAFLVDDPLVGNRFIEQRRRSTGAASARPR
ncbi:MULTISPECIES: hypothetical protein [unclassified Sphingopyxis]|uniref:hypothetical protein n=1 Tax=unclassified Sphingopyxis TaxID=2614943 RepID=UPI0028621010|nr:MULTISPECIES: hypothetical protein [unclassified Sphingopyxis]MDR6832046.1 hypothetical protein [Sphingopyxis sp. BE122]MDR7227788.1 hypothetical protein [Sphingopyxis sp. BE259]